MHHQRLLYNRFWTFIFNTDFSTLIIQPDDVDIDVNDPEVQKAAAKIQAGFRGHMTRKQLKSPQGTSYHRDYK